MEPVIIAEVLERSHKVRERVRLTHFPVRIGRAYDNDVILDDAFVSPHHAELTLDAEGQVVLSDLQSENGTLRLPKLEAVKQFTLEQDTLLRLGHTLLRLRTPEVALAPARIDTLSRSRLGRWLGSGTALFVLATLMLGLVALAVYQSSAQRIGISRLLLQTVEIAAFIPLWAGLWALISRAFSHHAAYRPHAAIACLALIGFLGLDTLSEYLAFAFSADLLADIAFHVLFGILVAAVLYAHLRFATLILPKRAGLVACTLASAGVAFSGFALYVQSLDFSDTLPYPPELKPDSFRAVPAKSVEQFAHDAARLAPDE